MHKRLLAAAVAVMGLMALAGCASGGATHQVAATPTLSSSVASVPTVSPVTSAPAPIAVVTQTVTVSTSVAPPPPPPVVVVKTNTITGTLFMVGNRNTSYPANCAGFSQDGQGDIQVGAVVTVRSGTEQILAVGNLTACKFTDIEGSGQSLSLTFSFKVANVPDSDIYTVEVAHRGEVAFSRAKLVAAGWKANLSL